MGAANAKAEINSAVQSAVTVVNNNNQTCTNRNVGGQSIVINCNTIENNKISINSDNVIDLSCVQNVTISNDVKQQIINNFKNTADSVVQALGAGYANATAIVDTTVNLGVSMTNGTMQTCANNSAYTQSILLNCQGPGGAAIGNIVEINSFSQAMIDCAQTVNESNGISSNVEQVIDNTASATVEGILGPLLFLLLLVGAILLIIFVGGGKTFIAIIFFIIVLVGVYLAAAYIKGWVPFSRN